MARKKPTKQFMNCAKQAKTVKLKQIVTAITSLFLIICLTSCANTTTSKKIGSDCVMSVVTWGHALECLRELDSY